MPRKWDEAAKDVWDFLGECAKDKVTVEYNHIAKLVHTSALSVRYVLDPIQQYCMIVSLPPMTSIVVSKGTGKPGAGFVAWPIHDIENAQRSVYCMDWQAYGNPFTVFSQIPSISDLAKTIVQDPNESKYIAGIVSDRGHRERLFRDAVWECSEGACAFCRVSIECTLEATYILPWPHAADAARIDPRNGLLLCANHKKLFEYMEITIDDQCKIVVPAETLAERSSAERPDKALLHAIDGKSILLPVNSKHHPRKDWIDLRNSLL